MSLFRKFFLKKTPDRLLEISERIYVFDCCFSTDSMDDDEYRDYLSGIVAQLQEVFPDASFLVSNFWSGDKRSRISDILSDYDMTVMDYPQQYEGCPLLQLELIHHFLKLCENWLSVEGQHNMLLMHCERGGWPMLAFMLTGLFLYRKTYTGEQKTLDMVYKQAPRDFIFVPLNPQPSHLRYLHYITRQGGGSEWPPISRPLILDSVVLHVVPRFETDGGCRPYLRVHGQPNYKRAKVLYEMPKTKKHLQRYGQAEGPIKLCVLCHVHGDVVLEFIHIGDNMEHKETMFQVMFNTAFVQSNILGLNRDDIDVSWNVNNQFPRDFRAEVHFSDPDSFKPTATAEEIADDGDEIDVASVVEELWNDARKDPETQSTDGGISLDGIAEFDGGVATEESSSLEKHRSDEGVKIVVSQNLGSMNEKGASTPSSSFENQKGLQQPCELLANAKLSNTNGQENSDVHDIQVVATSVGTQVVQTPQILYTETVHEDSRYMELNILERIVNESEEPSPLDFALLHSITENFAEKKEIGRGGCGTVYKGILRNGVIVVKRLHNTRTIKDKMFHREVKSLFSVKHPNIVRFLGYCSFTKEHAIPLEGTIIMVDIRERLLCFEYIRNGSLEQHLSDELRGLEWQIRYQIILGICRGLHYLHKDKKIIHMDLKPGNILLDDLMVPKITDFGLSRLESDSLATTTRLMSQGYTAPEYISGDKATSKSDIYSLGVIIAELVTGSRTKPNITKVIRRWNHRWNKSMKQSLLAYQQVKKCLELALRCIQDDPTDRPDISDIIDGLKEIDTKDGQTQIQVSPCCMEDILGIEPLEIHIPFEDFKASHSIELTNDKDCYIAFVTKPKHRYRTEPDRGVVPPRSKCNVTLAMQAQFNNAVPNKHYTEVISVLSTRVDNGAPNATDITAGDIFIDSEDGNVVDEVNVIVVFGAPELVEE